MKKQQLYAGEEPIEPIVGLSEYVQKEIGKGLSTCDFSKEYRDRIDGMEEGAQKNEVTGVKGSAEIEYRKGSVNITKDNLGIPAVENKSSRQIREEITRENIAVSLGYTPEIEGAYENAAAYTDTRIAELIHGAPETMDTLKEVADAIQENKTIADALDAAIGKKANQAELDTHDGNDAIHITPDERTKWNGVAGILGNVKSITDSAEVSDSNILASSAALHQVFQLVSNGKRVLAAAITDRGIPTAADAAFQTMADNIGNLSQPTGNAAEAQVLAGYTFSSAAGTGLTGRMTNRGAVNNALNAGQAYAVPEGYHNGAGMITANSLASQTAATAAAAHISSGKTAWANGVKVTGTGGDNTAYYNAGVAAADGRPNAGSVNYQTGYNAGVTAADARANPASVNYKTGYNEGYNAKVNGSLTKHYLNSAFVSGTTTYNIASITANYRSLNINNFGYEAQANTTAISGSISTSGNDKTAEIALSYNASTGVLTVTGGKVQIQTSFLITTMAKYRPYVLL